MAQGPDPTRTGSDSISLQCLLVAERARRSSDTNGPRSGQPPVPPGSRTRTSVLRHNRSATTAQPGPFQVTVISGAFATCIRSRSEYSRDRSFERLPIDEHPPIRAQLVESSLSPSNEFPVWSSEGTSRVQPFRYQATRLFRKFALRMPGAVLVVHHGRPEVQ